LVEIHARINGLINIGDAKTLIEAGRLLRKTGNKQKNRAGENQQKAAHTHLTEMPDFNGWLIGRARPREVMGIFIWLRRVAMASIFGSV
jgi:hypothetical protein